MLDTTNVSAWVYVIAMLINLGITTEQQVEALIKSHTSKPDTDPDVQANTAAMMLSIRQQLAAIRAAAQAEANRME